MTTAQKFTLPGQLPKTYAPALECIYCGSPDRLTKEHIIPFAAGGRWILPNASCQACSTITGGFEGGLSRTVLGPLRMLYDLPTRRPKDRPRHLPLKVKYPTSTDWEIAYVDRSICPFLVGLPLYPLPEALTGVSTADNRDAATSSIWLHAAGFRGDLDTHLQWLCDALGATEVMPIATVHTEPFCLTLAKIAHSFTAAELGVHGFEPFLIPLILHREFRFVQRLLAAEGGMSRHQSTCTNLNSPMT